MLQEEEDKDIRLGLTYLEKMVVCDHFWSKMRFDCGKMSGQVKG